jgi:hypothetical protein
MGGCWIGDADWISFSEKALYEVFSGFRRLKIRISAFPRILEKSQWPGTGGERRPLFDSEVSFRHAVWGDKSWVTNHL